MKTVSLSGSLRSNVGSKDANALRAKGMVPCVIYGGKEQTHFYADARAFKHIIYTPEACFVNINLDGKEYKAILQDSQYHKLNDRLIHVDFLEVVEGKELTMHIPIKLKGQSVGVKDGGKLVQKLRKLKVKASPDKMPQEIELNIENLAIGKSISAGDIKIDGVTLLHPSNISVVSVAVTRNVVEEPAKAAATTAAPAADKKAAAPAKK